MCMHMQGSDGMHLAQLLCCLLQPRRMHALQVVHIGRQPGKLAWSGESEAALLELRFEVPEVRVRVRVRVRVKGEGEG